MANPLHRWDGYLSDTFYPEGNVVGAFKAWRLAQEGERVKFDDGVIQWIPNAGDANG